ncbi:hypothetical protein BC829DRAFT_416690 [Chytridium lagenaria]|nr:hypothetical protein BC829DRAFT_416690 [Chytridium lagenaria]
MSHVTQLIISEIEVMYQQIYRHFIASPVENWNLAENLCATTSSVNKEMSTIMHAVTHQHASRAVKEYCIYIIKGPSTITNWIDDFEKNGDVQDRKRVTVYRKFSAGEREWITALYDKNPILYLDEAQHAFQEHFAKSISKSCLSSILHSEGYTWKVLERRAIQVNRLDVIRFWNELNELPWISHNLVFLDEVGFDNRDMIRRKGFGIKGEKLFFRGEFIRKARTSLLCFIGVDGVLESYPTEGTYLNTQDFILYG